MIELCKLKLHTAGYKILTRWERKRIYWIEERRKVYINFIANLLMVVSLIGWTAFCTSLADSKVNWYNPGYGIIEICEGLTVGVIYLKGEEK